MIDKKKVKRRACNMCNRSVPADKAIEVTKQLLWRKGDLHKVIRAGCYLCEKCEFYCDEV